MISHKGSDLLTKILNIVYKDIFENIYAISNWLNIHQIINCIITVLHCSIMSSNFILWYSCTKKKKKKIHCTQ